MSFGITPTGFVPKDFDILRQELIDLSLATMSPNLDQRITNPLIQMISITAAQYQRYENLMNDLYAQVHVITSSGTSLDTHAAERGLTRQLAGKSIGDITVTGSPASVITSGAIFSTSGDISTQFASQQRVEIGQTTETFIGSAVTSFQVTAQATGSFGTNQIVFIKNTSNPWTEVIDNPPLNDLEFYVDYANPTTIIIKNAVLTTDLVTITYYNDATTQETVPVQAVVAGISGNVGANTIDTLVTPLAGITAVNNASTFTGGTDREEDPAFKLRLINATLARWTEADLKALLEDIEGVRTVEIDDGITTEAFLVGTQGTISTWYSQTLSISAQRVFRAKFFDESAGTTVDWVETTGDPAPGQYRLIGPSDIFEYGTPMEPAGLDTLTITFMDNFVGTGVFNVNVIGDSNPITSTLRDTIESTLVVRKPFGVSPFVIQPNFLNLRMTITTVLDTGFSLLDVQSSIEDDVGAFIATLTIGQDLIHYQVVEIAMNVEGMLDISVINYQIIDESIIKGTTDSIDDTLLAPSTLIGSVITDEDGNTYDINIHYQYNVAGVDWSIGSRQIDFFKRFDVTGGTYDSTDNTAAISLSASTFGLFDVDPEIGDYHLVGQDDRFNKIDYDVTTPGDGAWELLVSFWNGSGWTPCTNVKDTTQATLLSFTQDGSITFDNPGLAWVSNTIDSDNAYWIKVELVTTTVIVNTAPICESIQTDREPVQNKLYTVSYNLDDDNNIVVPENAIVIEESTVVQ